MELVLSPRLEAVASCVRDGALLSDVGTDHALLPAALLLSGRIRGAIASDIVKGPLERANETVKKYGLSEKITTLLTPGLCGLEKFSPTDIVIAGMGGHTVAEILKQAPFVKNKDVRLILQPMTKGEILRDYLAKEGFEILFEKRAREGERIYSILCCRYTGTPYTLSSLELLLGKNDQETPDPLFCALLEKKREQLLAVVLAKGQNGVPCPEEIALLEELERALQDENTK